jgi:hypothetical protein
MVKFGENEAITVNDLDFKNKIIDYLFSAIDISKYRYNILETVSQLNDLKINEHYVSPNFKGYNYFLIFNRYNNIPYCVAVDRKNLSYHRDKVDIKKLPIFKIKILANQSIFRGTIIDCKLIKNIMMIKDCFQIMGNNIIDMDMFDKMIYLDSIIINQFQKDYCSNFSLKINKLYRYNMLNDMITNIIPNCNYDIQGLIFLPKISGISIIYVDKKNQQSDTKIEITNNNIITNSPNYNNSSINMINDMKEFLLSRTYSYETDGKISNLYVEKTNIIDVYNIYENKDTYNKIGIAHIPSMKISQYCNENIIDKHLCKCIYYKEFNKWIPLQVL